jgi:uncharacterized protein (DUF2236 family)
MEEEGAQLAPGIFPDPVWVPPGPTPAEVALAGAAGIGAALAAPLLRPPLLGALGSLLGPPAPGAPPETSSGGRARGAPATPSSPPPSHPGTSLYPSAPGDPGWFGPDSVAWRVHGDSAMLVAGITAFALQLLHPLALAGVADHSAFADDFFGRTRRTGEFVSGVVYGSSAEAAARVAEVHRVHDRVVGTAPDGRPYSAHDPELLAWVHVTEHLAIAAVARRFGLFPLSRADLDRYVDEVAVVGQAMRVENPPRSWAELDAAFQRFRPHLAAGEQARVAVQFLRHPPGLSRGAQMAWRVLWAGAVTCLPPSARRLLALPPPPVPDVLGARALVRTIGATLGPPPPLLAARRRLGLGV